VTLPVLAHCAGRLEVAAAEAGWKQVRCGRTAPPVADWSAGGCQEAAAALAGAPVEWPASRPVSAADRSEVEGYRTLVADVQPSHSSRWSRSSVAPAIYSPLFNHNGRNNTAVQ